MRQTEGPACTHKLYCPYPGCNRSFMKLWRLKVHYRAPPDARGSGFERGHGTELSHCPKCGTCLERGKHHFRCSGNKTSQRSNIVPPTSSAALATTAARQPPMLSQVHFKTTSWSQPQVMESEPDAVPIAAAVAVTGAPLSHHHQHIPDTLDVSRDGQKLFGVAAIKLVFPQEAAAVEQGGGPRQVQLYCHVPPASMAAGGGLQEGSSPLLGPFTCTLNASSCRTDITMAATPHLMRLLGLTSLGAFEVPPALRLSVLSDGRVVIGRAETPHAGTSGFSAGSTRSCTAAPASAAADMATDTAAGQAPFEGGVATHGVAVAPSAGVWTGQQSLPPPCLSTWEGAGSSFGSSRTGAAVENLEQLLPRQPWADTDTVDGGSQGGDFVARIVRIGLADFAAACRYVT